MTLANLIRKRHTGSIATAIPAIPATRKGERGGTVARIATVAVANPASEKLGATEAAVIHAWLTHIGETDPAMIAEAMQRCASDPEALTYFLWRSKKCLSLIPIKPTRSRAE